MQNSFLLKTDPRVSISRNRIINFVHYYYKNNRVGPFIRTTYDNNLLRFLILLEKGKAIESERGGRTGLGAETETHVRVRFKYYTTATPVK